MSVIHPEFILHFKETKLSVLGVTETVIFLLG